MSKQSRRAFFKTVFSAGAALAASGTGSLALKAEAAGKGEIDGICLYVPTLGKASEFVELMNRNAPGKWSVQPLQGTLTDCYFTTREMYQQARDGKSNTFVGVVDPATFAVIHEAVADSGGSFHYVTYEERNRVTFSAQV
jgi:hypothetical protein